MYTWKDSEDLVKSFKPCPFLIVKDEEKHDGTELGMIKGGHLHVSTLLHSTAFVQISMQSISFRINFIPLTSSPAIKELITQLFGLISSFIVLNYWFVDLSSSIRKEAEIFRFHSINQHGCWSFRLLRNLIAAANDPSTICYCKYIKWVNGRAIDRGAYLGDLFDVFQTLLAATYVVARLGK